MRKARVAVACLLAAGFAMSMTEARADWMFRRSYSSHLPLGVSTSEDVPESRAAYRHAVPQRGPGYQVRGGQRFNIYRLNSGQSWDTTIYREFFIEEGSER